MENSTFISTSELNDYINRGITKWYGKLVTASSCPSWFRKEVNVTTNSGQISYALTGLASDIRSILGVYVQESTTRRREVLHMQPGTEVMFDAPTASYTVTLRYIPTPPQLTTDNSDATGQIDDISGWSELIVLYGARWCLAKEESDTNDVLVEIASEEARLLNEMGQLDVSGPRYINDTESSTYLPIWAATQSVDAWMVEGGNLYLYQYSAVFP